MDSILRTGFRHWCHLILGGLFLLDGIVPVSASDESMTSISVVDSGKILRSVLNKSDPGVRPNVDGPPVFVRCSISIVSFGPFSEVNMEYQLNIYFRQKWVDPRLSFRRVGDIDHVIVSAKDIESVWKPDLFFPNEKLAAFHHVTVPNKLLRVYDNGTVVYSTRITLTLACPMDLFRFPMDQQRCSVHIESYGYETKDLELEWDGKSGVGHANQMHLTQFQLVSEKTVKTSVSYGIGTFSRLTATFDLERLYGFYLLQIYVPTILIVILAWVSFWVNMDSAPARISLGVTTLLTMATQLSGSKASIPKVHYPKAIDVWMTMCMMFVFVAMVEYAFVNALSRDTPKKEKEVEEGKECENNNTFRGLTVEKFVEPYVFEPTLKLRKTCGFSSGREAALFLERVSQICFPISFITFNIIYWSVYLRPHEY